MTEQFHKEEQTYSSQKQFSEIWQARKNKTAIVEESQPISGDNFQNLPYHNLILHQYITIVRTLTITHQNVRREIQFTPVLNKIGYRARKFPNPSNVPSTMRVASKYTELLFREAFPGRILSLPIYSILYDRN